MNGSAQSSHARIGLTELLPVAFQLGLVLAVALLFRIELERGFAAVAPLIFIGFLLHSRFPERARIPFFTLLTFVALVVLLRVDGLWVVGLGLGILGLCHLPFAWSVRVGLLLLAATGLAALQGGWLKTPWASPVIPILASMFMFRVILYLYDLKTGKTPADPWARIAYFFLLPNVCFPLFPVVDYKTFLRTYYDAPAVEIYQKGVYWMLRGVIHLLLYRAIYYALPRFSDPSDVVGVYVFMAMTYAMYLRVSGLFHLITGVLCLFGFNVPPTNNHYFLASSFNDLWRRINIYWKDFMMTVVFYPVFMSIRRWRLAIRLIIGTGMVFFFTWLLHSYQWFWLEGGFPVRANDIVFWGFLGLALAANSVWEARHGRRRLARSEWSLTESLGVTARTIGVFSTMAVLWSLWYSGSLAEWWYLVVRVGGSEARDWLLFGGLLVLALVVGVGGHWLSAHDRGLSRIERFAWSRASLLVPTVSAAMVIIGLPFVYGQGEGRVARAVQTVQSTRPNQDDLDREERGYYEALTRATQFGPSVAATTPTADEGEDLFRKSQAVRSTGDIRGFEIVPGAEIVFKGVDFRANRLGFRDREYELSKPAGTYRVALLGSSHTMGSGVGNEQTFENLVEDRLNTELGSRGFDRYEILNFAVAGYALYHAVYVAERIVPRFEPDAVIYVAHPREGTRLIRRLRILLASGEGNLEGYEYLAEVLRKADAHSGLPPDEFERRLSPFRDDLVRGSYSRMARAIRAHGAVPVLALVPLTHEAFDGEEIGRLSRLAEESQAILMTVPDPYDGYELERITVSDTDRHPNAIGHRLIADRFFESLLENAAALGLFPEPIPNVDSPES
ncbi:MAG TPA: hypothetical protein VJP59_11390 [Gemmatimonadota bacterium]|nr:hypothetical protein [Gemmatimonadota bacterium]